jgi:hypothetical protein
MRMAQEAQDAAEGAGVAEGAGRSGTEVAARLGRVAQKHCDKKNIWFMFALRVLCLWWIDAATCPAVGVTCSSGAGNSASSRQCHPRVASS